VPKLRRVDPADRERLIGEIKAFAAQLRSCFPNRENLPLWLLCRGEIHEGSDIDLIIVGDFRERFFERIGRILELTDLPVEPLVYTPEEFEAMKASRNPFIEEVLRTGIEL
jgi:predicted nucleotidyltransferase